MYEKILTEDIRFCIVLYRIISFWHDEQLKNIVFID